METVLITCVNCESQIEDEGERTERKPCPQCGATARRISMSITEEVVIAAYDLIRARSKDLSRRSKDKQRVEVISGHELHRNSGKWYLKERVIDKDKDYYFEKIVDPVSGAVVRECEEKLSEHQGRGSAKPRGDT